MNRNNKNKKLGQTTGCLMNSEALSRFYGATSTVHDRYQE